MKLTYKSEKQLNSLFEYIENNIQEDSLFSARQECAIARHTMKAAMLAYEGIINKVRENPDLLTEKTSDLLIHISDKVRKDAEQTVNILKKAAETEVLLSSRLDPLQVIALLEQLPAIITSELEKALNEIAIDLDSHLKEKEKCLANSKEVRSHDFLTPLESKRKLIINDIVAQVSAILTDRIRSLSVPGTGGGETGASDGAGRVTESEVEQMMASLLPSERE